MYNFHDQVFFYDETIILNIMHRVWLVFRKDPVIICRVINSAKIVSYEIFTDIEYNNRMQIKYFNRISIEFSLKVSLADFLIVSFLSIMFTIKKEY